MVAKNYLKATAVVATIYLSACGSSSPRVIDTAAQAEPQTTVVIPASLDAPTRIDTSDGVSDQDGSSVQLNGAPQPNASIQNDNTSAPLTVDNQNNCVPAGSLNKRVSVLLIGNSLMNDVQSKVEELLTCAGYTPEMASSNPGGYTLERHTTNQQTTELIEKGFAITLLQEHSGGIVKHDSPYKTLNTLKQRIDEAGSTLGFYQTWEYQERNPVVTESILSGYEDIANEFGAPVIAIGRAWDYFYTSYNESPPFELFHDYAHATDHGKNLIAFVLYAYLTGQSPVYLSSLSISDDDAFILQTIAWDTYQARR